MNRDIKRYFCICIVDNQVRVFYAHNRQLKQVSFDFMEEALNNIMDTEREGYKHIAVSFAKKGSKAYQILLSEVQAHRQAGDDFWIKFVPEKQIKGFKFFDWMRNSIQKVLVAERKALKNQAPTNTIVMPKGNDPLAR